MAWAIAGFKLPTRKKAPCGEHLVVTTTTSGILNLFRGSGVNINSGRVLVSCPAILPSRSATCRKTPSRTTSTNLGTSESPDIHARISFAASARTAAGISWVALWSMPCAPRITSWWARQPVTIAVCSSVRRSTPRRTSCIRSTPVDHLLADLLQHSLRGCNHGRISSRGNSRG